MHELNDLSTQQLRDIDIRGSYRSTKGKNGTAKNGWEKGKKLP